MICYLLWLLLLKDIIDQRTEGFLLLGELTYSFAYMYLLTYFGIRFSYIISAFEINVFVGDEFKQPG